MNLTLAQGCPRSLFLFLTIHLPIGCYKSVPQRLIVPLNKIHRSTFLPAMDNVLGEGDLRQGGIGYRDPSPLPPPARVISLDCRRTRDLEILSQKNSWISCSGMSPVLLPVLHTVPI